MLLLSNVLFTNIDLDQTTVIYIYGESAEDKYFEGPVIFNCLVERGDEQYPDNRFRS